jgi:hypothetical protein
MNTIQNTAIVAGLTITMLASYQATVRDIIPALQGAINHQEETVQVAEAVGSSAAPAARIQWDARKASAQLQLDALAAWANSDQSAYNTGTDTINLTVTEGTNSTEITLQPEQIQ